MEISRENYEYAMAMAASATMQVYDRIRPALERTMEETEKRILGKPGTEALPKRLLLETATIRYVSVAATVDSLAELDLVLTPTGFGVVSNETTAPASRERVDRLATELRHKREQLLGDLGDLLCEVDGWADTDAAKRLVDCCVWNIRGIERRWGQDVTLEQWQGIRQAAMETHDRMINLIGRPQMDALLDRLRRDDAASPYRDVVYMIETLTLCHYSHTPGQAERERQMLKYIESQPDDFKEYMDSDEYQANHWQRFENQQDASAYCFLG